MMRRPVRAALAALSIPLLLAAPPAFADSDAASTLPAVRPVSDADEAGFASPSRASAVAAVAVGFASAPSDAPSLATARDDGPTRLASGDHPRTRYEATRYRPRRERGHRGGWRARGVSQIHAGFLDPDGDPESGFLAGFRGGQKIDDVLEIGLGVDWRTRSGRSFATAQETIGPGGEIIVVRRDVSSYSSNLFPLLAYVQLSGPSHLTLVPYAGAAASWQVLFLHADDFTTGQSFEATFDGFGWQLWGGAAFPLSGRSRLIGEIFMNRADLHRDAYDPFLGQDVRETVSVDGVGARFGFNWGF